MVSGSVPANAALDSKHLGVTSTYGTVDDGLNVAALGALAETSDGQLWDFDPRNEALQTVPTLVQTPVRRSWSALTLTLLLFVVTGFVICHLRIQFLEQRSRRQAAFAKVVVESQENERKRILSELHDSLGQDLLLIQNYTELARRKNQTDSYLRDIAKTASHAIGETRSIIANLRPVELDRLGLRAAVEGMADRLRESSSVDIRCALNALDLDFTDNQMICIYRIFQEGLNNALKHAEAKTICLRSTLKGGKLILEIDDDGRGFEPAGAKRQMNRSSMGIQSLDERARLLDGRLSITSEINQGTCLKITLPAPRRIR